MNASGRSKAKVIPLFPSPKPSPPEGPVAYRNRMGATFYLHEGRTKSGKPRYFMAKSIGEGALTKVPEGFEICESINGVVSVRRMNEARATVPPDDIALVHSVIERYSHLRYYLARAVDSAIVIYEPNPLPKQFEEMLFEYGIGHIPADAIAERMSHAQYSPIMKFEPQEDEYVVRRMTFRGHGGWSYPLNIVIEPSAGVDNAPPPDVFGGDWS